MSEPETARLTVRRHRDWNDVLRAYRVCVDGVEVGRVRRGREVTVEIEPGVRTVTAHIDWCGSRPVTVAAGPGEHVEMAVRNALEGWRGALVFVVVFWHRHEYLELEHVRGGGRPPQRPVDRGASGRH